MQILDHGYLRLIETWGSDSRIIESARMSTNKGFLGWGGSPCPDCKTIASAEDLFQSPWVWLRPESCTCKGTGKTIGDEKLLRYLWENKHATPFEQSGLTFEVQAPIFVFREWHRHRVQSFNEMSARYTPLPDLNYIPTVERLMMGVRDGNRQAGTIADAEILTLAEAEYYRQSLAQHYLHCETLYQRALAAGIPKELARIHLPVGRYSRMRASANLRNWLGFLTLRMDPKAQYEIRVYAEAVGRLISEHFPRTWELFNESH